MRVHPAVFQSARRLWLFAPVAGVCSLGIYLLSFSTGSYPGYSGDFVAKAAGLTPPSGAAHPIFSLLTRQVAAWDVLPLTVRLNLLSVLCGALCAALLCYLVAKLILFAASEDGGGRAYNALIEMDIAVPVLQPEVEVYNRRIFKIAVIGGLCAAFLLTFLAPTWSAATRLECGSFHLLLVLVALTLCPLKESKAKVGRLALIVFLCVLGVFDTAAFLLVVPFFVYQVFSRFWQTSQRRVLVKVLLLAGAAGLALSVYAYWRNTDPLLLANKSARSVFAFLARGVVYHHWDELRALFPRSGWLLLILQTVVPASVLLFGQELLFKQRQARTLAAMFLVTLIGLPTLWTLPFAPFRIFQVSGHLPVFGAALVAAAVALVGAAGLVFLEPEDFLHDAELLNKSDSKRQRRLAWMKTITGVFLGIFLLMVLLVPQLSFRVVDTRRGAFADTFAREILAAMNGRTWLVSNGYLDNHLLVQAHMLKQPLVLVTLRRVETQLSKEPLVRQIAENPIFAGHNLQRLQNALSLGTVRFLMEWFTTDEDAGRNVMVFATPDLWTACGYKAVPEGFAFGGVKPGKVPEFSGLIERNERFVARLLPLFDKSNAQVPFLAMLHEMLLMKAGLAANELGVMLDDANEHEAAYQAYARASQIDSDNISAAINIFALADSQKLHPESHGSLKKKVRSVIAGRKYQTSMLTGILQNYGTVRQQAFYRQQSVLWMTQGMDSVAVEKNRKALALSQQTGAAALVENASFYFQSGDSAKAEDCYVSALELDPSNKEALAGMSMLMTMKRDAKVAEKWLLRALAAGVDKDTVLYQTIKLALLKGDIAGALKQLKEATEKFPLDYRYWYLRADLLLQQGDRQSVEFQLLPGMQAALKDPKHFVILAVRGFLLRAKGPKFYREARQTLFRALAANASLPEVWNAIFEIDIALGDITFMEADARQRLLTEPDHALANYLMGAALIRRNALREAEDFFRRSIENTPTVLAFNDLAECLRLQQKLVEAETFARRALVIEPNLLPAMDTLAGVLCDAGKHEEASQWALKTLAKRPDRPAFQLTLLRIRVKQGDSAGVNELLKVLAELKTAIPEALQKEIDVLMKKKS